MPTQAHHDWVKAFVRMAGGGPPAAALAGASAAAATLPTGEGAAAPAEDAEEMSPAPDHSLASDGDGGMSLPPGNGAEGAAGEDAKSEGTGAKRVNLAIPFTKDITEEHELWKKSIWGGRFEITVKVKGVITGTAEFDSKAAAGEKGGEEEGAEVAASLGWDADAVAGSIAEAWINKDGVTVLGLDTIFTEIEQKGTFSANFEKAELSYEFAGKLACNAAFSLKVIAVGWEGGSKGELKVSSVEFGAQIPILPITANLPVIRGGTLKNVGIAPVLTGELVPNWAEIIKDVAKKAAKDAATGGGELAAFDIAVLGGLFAAAVGVVVGSLAQLVEGDAVNAAGDVAEAAVAAVIEGYRAGLTGEAAPSDPVAGPTYQKGRALFQQAAAIVKQKIPDEDDDTIRDIIAEAVDKMKVMDKARPELEATTREAVWEHYATNYPNRIDRMTAWKGIYGSRASFDNPLFKTYDKS